MSGCHIDDEAPRHYEIKVNRPDHSFILINPPRAIRRYRVFAGAMLEKSPPHPFFVEYHRFCALPQKTSCWLYCKFFYSPTISMLFVRLLRLTSSRRQVLGVYQGASPRDTFLHATNRPWELWWAVIRFGHSAFRHSSFISVENCRFTEEQGETLGSLMVVWSWW